MEYLYCGGTFHFDYQNENYRTEASQDYRAIILGGLDGLLKNDGVVKLSERASYVGPFYFESDGMVDRTIVSTEKAQVRRARRPSSSWRMRAAQARSGR